MRNWKKMLAFAASAATFASAASVTVSPSQTAQSVVGFGGGVVYYQGWVTAMSDNTVREAFYDTAFTGLNLSLLRLGNWLQKDDADISADVEIVKAAKNRLGDHLKIEMSSWSAPGNLKGSGSVNGSDANGDTTKASLNKSSSDSYGAYDYTNFASWWKKSLQTYAASGISPDYISLQNEPDMFAEYEETLFDPTETTLKAGYAQALNAVYCAVKSLPNAPKILGPEPLGIGYNNFQKYVSALDKSKLDGYAYHLYHAGSGNDNSGNNYLNPENFRTSMSEIASSYYSADKPIIMTEFCTMLDAPRETDMVGLAHIMQVGFTSGKLSGYIAWNLLWGESGQMIGVCAAGWGGCADDGFTISPEYHAMRHYSKFVNPGWSVVTTAADNESLKTVAFKSAAGDSVSVIVINIGSTEQKISAPTVAGLNVATAVQSKENGFKSKTITNASCFVLPARSVTTLVYTKSAAAASVATCADETTDPNYQEPVVTPSEDVVIVDYSTTTDVSTWKSMSDDLAAPTYVSTALDGKTGYVSVPLAGCDQSEETCGYKNQLLNVSDEAAAGIANCSDLVITMRSADTKNAYVNVGGANSSSWVDYAYGKTASASEWSETKVSLAKEGQNGSTALTFNSNASGIYIAKIVATGCSSSAIPQRVRLNATSNGVAKIYNLRGRLVWTGELSSADLSGRELHLQNLNAGIYLVRIGSKALTAVKK